MKFKVRLLDYRGVLVEENTLPIQEARQLAQRFIDAQLAYGENGGRVEFNPVFGLDRETQEVSFLLTVTLNDLMRGKAVLDDKAYEAFGSYALQDIGYEVDEGDGNSVTLRVTATLEEE